MKKTKKITVTIKSETAWAIVSPRGWLLQFTVRPTRKQTVQEICDNYGMPWAEAKHEGFRCVKVRIVFPSVIK